MSDSTKRIEEGTKRMDSGTVRMNTEEGTKRMDSEAGTARMDAGTARMDAGTMRMDGGSTARAESAGPMGIVVFAKGQPLELNGKNCTIESIISMDSGEAIVYKITIDGKPFVFKHYKINTPLTEMAKKVLTRACSH